MLELIRRRRFPVVGDGGGVWSFIHIDDAAAATVAALEHGAPRRLQRRRRRARAGRATGCRGRRGAVGAQAAAARAALARAAPRRRGRRAVMMTEVRGASNAKAERELGWTPRHPSWRTGFAGGGAEAVRRAATRRCARRPSRSPTGCSAASAEAEDVVQEAFLRVHRELEAGEPIASPRRSPTTVVTRLAIDELRSARARRERYVGEWLPEPLVTDGDDDPAAHAELSESLVLAFLVLLESLSPEQRAVFLLHDVFDYGYDEIAAILGKSAASGAPARRRGPGGTSTSAGPASRARRSSASARRERFFAAVEQGDVEGLEALLAQDVVLHGDGGGKVPALARPARGRARVARTLAGLGAGRRAPGRRHPAARRRQRPARVARARPRRPRPQRLGARRRATARCTPSARSSTRTSSATSGRWATTARCSRRRGARTEGLAPAAAVVPGSDGPRASAGRCTASRVVEGRMVASHRPGLARRLLAAVRGRGRGRRARGRLLRRPGPGDRRDRHRGDAQRPRRLRRRVPDAVRMAVALAPVRRHRVDRQDRRTGRFARRRRRSRCASGHRRWRRTRATSGRSAAGVTASRRWPGAPARPSARASPPGRPVGRAGP